MNTEYLKSNFEYIESERPPRLADKFSLPLSYAFRELYSQGTSLAKKVAKLPIVKIVATAGIMATATACDSSQIRNIGEPRYQQTQSQPYAEPTLVSIGGPETIIPDYILKIKDKLDNKQALTDAERLLVLDFNKTHQPTNNETKILESHTLEETLTKMEDLNQKIETIYKLRADRMSSGISIVPTSALGTMFNKVKTDLQKLTDIKNTNANSPDSITAINNIYLSYSTPNFKERPSSRPLVKIDPTADESEKVASLINKFVDTFPNLGYAAGEIQYESRSVRGDWPYDAGAETFQDKLGIIIIRDHPQYMQGNDGEDKWTEEKLLQVLIHELIHIISLNGNGYLLNYFSPETIINSYYDNTLTWDQVIRGTNGIVMWDTEDEESDGWLASEMAINSKTISTTEISKTRQNNINKRFSIIFAQEINLQTLGQTFLSTPNNHN